MRPVLALLVIAVLAPLAFGQGTYAFESWEGSHTLLGQYGSGNPPIIAEAVADTPIDPVHGTQVLRLVDNSPSGTPQGYVAWVKGLSAGDMVTVSLWRYDETPDASPSCRIWGHWNDDPGDINGYAGSAGGNEDYGLGMGWDQTSWTWTVPQDRAHSGLVVEVRTYSEPGDTVWVDSMEVSCTGDVVIITPEIGTPVEVESWSSIKALYR